MPSGIELIRHEGSIAGYTCFVFYLTGQGIVEVGRVSNPPYLPIMSSSPGQDKDEPM
jgi:hypothetical protein